MVDGRRLRILAVVDDCTRECLALVGIAAPAQRAAPLGRHDPEFFPAYAYAGKMREVSA